MGAIIEGISRTTNSKAMVFNTLLTDQNIMANGQRARSMAKEPGSMLMAVLTQEADCMMRNMGMVSINAMMVPSTRETL